MTPSLVGIVLIAAVASAADVSSPEKHLIPGETLSYGSAHGRLEMTVSRGNAYRLQSDLSLKGVGGELSAYQGRMISEVDPQIFRSLRYFARRGSGRQVKLKDVSIDYDRWKISQTAYQDNEQVPEEREVSDFDDAALQDPLSFVYLMRTFNFPYARGKTPTLHLYREKGPVEVQLNYRRLPRKWRGEKRVVVEIEPSEATRGILIAGYDVAITLDAETKIPLEFKLIKVPLVGDITLRFQGVP